ncbi:MAG: glycolate oxidase subunit GlcF [Pseudomonadales bacterium]|nr:glycolate oxidase subunit GlcF [Pseudomonadales bacterium]
MQTKIHPDLIGLAQVQEADDILRSCVHCGFCTATCPTYQLLGDELDGPRGRIYLVKELLETNTIESPAATHLDRCLTCRSCETTCPSGVRYGRLLDIARGLMASRVRRPLMTSLTSLLLRLVVPHPSLFGRLLQLGRWFSPVLPEKLANKIPNAQQVIPVTISKHDRSVIVLQGCVQRAATPNVNRALEVLLDEQHISVEYIENEGCCGALDYHLSAHEQGMNRMRRLIDELYPRLSSIEAIVSSASGCGVTIKEYPDILADDGEYADKAKQIADKVLDVSELMTGMSFQCRPIRAAVHTPCSLQHGQQINGAIEDILLRSGIDIVPSQEGHLCCGSAGAYSVLQPRLSEELKEAKLNALQKGNPEVLVTANIGCQLHLQTGTDVPVLHWTELLLQQR